MLIAMLTGLALATPTMSTATLAVSSPSTAVAGAKAGNGAAKICYTYGVTTDRFKLQYCNRGPLFGTLFGVILPVLKGIGTSRRSLSLALASCLLAALLAGAAQPAAADVGILQGTSCQARTCLEVRGDSRGYTARAWGWGYFGHIDMWAPGMPFTRSPEMWDPNVSNTGVLAGLVCARGWAYHAGGPYTEEGYPCVRVY